jgi:ABC-2 type transport system permease protein
MRIRTLVAREFLDLARNRAAMLPVAAMTAIVVAIPFAVVIVVPAMTGHPLGDDRDLAQASLVLDAPAELSADARVQLFLFQQFLVLFLLTPVTGAMALAAHAIVGEKQARTLEPLLASPITTGELLVAKVVGALMPTLVISLAGLLVYFGLVALVASPGVLPAMLTARTGLLVLLVGPCAALVALQAAIVISSRVNDARTAQQFGVLIVLPLTALAVAQFTGTVWLSATAIGLIGAGLGIVWLLLLVVSIAVFDRETILTRWR